MSNNPSTLGDRSPSLQAIVDELERQEINANTPPVDTEARRNLQADFNEEDEDLENNPTMATLDPAAIDLPALLQYLQSDPGKIALSQEGVDHQALEAVLSKKPSKTVRFDTSTPRRPATRDDLSGLHESAIKQNNRITTTTGSGKVHPELKLTKPPPYASQKCATL